MTGPAQYDRCAGDAAATVLAMETQLAAAHWDTVSARDVEEMYNPANRTLGSARESDTNWQMFGFYISNNIGVSFRTFASGLLIPMKRNPFGMDHGPRFELMHGPRAASSRASGISVTVPFAGRGAKSENHGGPRCAVR